MHSPTTECNDPVRSENWSPAWVVENRPPNVMNPNETSGPNVKEGNRGFGLGINVYEAFLPDASVSP